MSRLLPVAGPQLLGGGEEPLDELVVHSALDDHPVGGHADLSLVPVVAEGGRFRSVVKVGVGEDDERPVSSELEGESLDAGLAGDALADPGRAGEGDDAGNRVLDHGVPHLGAEADYDAQDSGR